MNRTLNEYSSVVGETAISQLTQLAETVKGARVVHVNSTKMGGGVAEILNWLIPLMNELGLETSWEVIEGNPDYFNVTKTFHNGLQGDDVSLTPAMKAAYEETVASNSDRLQNILNEADFVFIHDPQPAELIRHCSARKGKWIWRCHIDASHPNRKVWNYLKERVNLYDASIFSMPDFTQHLEHPEFIIAPSIDPLSDKNCDLTDQEISQTLEELQIPTDLPILTQISRFDRFKDPVGVIKAYRMLNGSVPSRLILAGGGATDDPEGAVVLKEVMEEAGTDSNIHILDLPADSHRKINALQRASAVVIQKSTQEGFGLTVTEAMWKSKPVIGGNVGGIRLQVHNHYTGFLVNTPEGAALRIRELLRHPDRSAEIGLNAKRFVKENFLLTRHIREYLTLMLGIKRGFANHLMTKAG